jgi:hypothetical protein
MAVNPMCMQRKVDLLSAVGVVHGLKAFPCPSALKQPCTASARTWMPSLEDDFCTPMRVMKRPRW